MGRVPGTLLAVHDAGSEGDGSGVLDLSRLWGVFAVYKFTHGSVDKNHGYAKG
jgi:hypothetical protein